MRPYPSHPASISAPWFRTIPRRHAVGGGDLPCYVRDNLHCREYLPPTNCYFRVISLKFNLHFRDSSDTGLLVSQAFASRPYTENELCRALLLDKLSVNEGMVAENAVAQALRTNGVELFSKIRQFETRQ